MALCLVNLLIPPSTKAYSVQVMTLFTRFSVSRNSWPVPTKKSMKGRRYLCAANGRRLVQGLPMVVAEWGPKGLSDVGGASVETSPVEGNLVNESSLSKIGFFIACPALGLPMLDSNAVAVDLNPISPALGFNLAAFTAKLVLSSVSMLGDLDPGTAQLATTFVGPLINIFNLLFIFRIVMSWYPGIPVQKFPFFLVYNPTEPVLGPTRRLIPPVGGVDVSPVIWVALMSFANEILLGKQGLLVLLSQQQP